MMTFLPKRTQQETGFWPKELKVATIRERMVEGITTQPPIITKGKERTITMDLVGSRDLRSRISIN